MTVVTIDDIKQILRDCAGEDEDVDLDGDIADRTFAQLGYDSLARLEVAARIKRDHGVDLVDDLTEAVTPADVVDLLSRRLAA